MIRLTKPAPPAVLTTRGAAATRANKAKYKTDRAAYRAGTKRFQFDRDIFAHPTVRTALRAAQHEKCAFCEWRISPGNTYSDVEHYRPKSGFKQRRGDPLTRPGYYWLAYDWDNLFLCCQLCNRAFKRNLFPIDAKGVRARSHFKSVGAEQPLLLHPCQDDPAKHLTFNGAVAVAVNQSVRGTVTIDVVGLNRPFIKEERIRRRVWLVDLCEARSDIRRQLAQQSSPHLLAALARLDRVIATAVADDAEFAAMARVTVF
ncbi:HNH endonuclease family protein [Urbifossiella limnaea]|uniref:TIGR02646 family protein n=1 Tax=Urbifossiella limnaea TaxID=2528023 RepID=A0A517XLC3_9BACT|nr:hypothetical protein [Urbifossiella limnaea]QDU18311.1 hypothetical protein ETAA1_01960 [Urbifossiella limnaea]